MPPQALNHRDTENTEKKEKNEISVFSDTKHCFVSVAYFIFAVAKPYAINYSNNYI
jgi:hypothetical protein